MQVANGLNFFHVDSTGCHGSTEILAKDSQPQGGDVPQRAGGDPGCHRALRVRQSAGASLQAASQVCFQPTLSGKATAQGRSGPATRTPTPIVP